MSHAFGVGDRIMAVVGGGAQATLATVDETYALPVPLDLSWAEAGGFPEAFSTACDALWDQAGVSLGERVLFTGAAGGVGTAGVQWPRQLARTSSPRPATPSTTGHCSNWGRERLSTRLQHHTGVHTTSSSRSSVLPACQALSRRLPLRAEWS